MALQFQRPAPVAPVAPVAAAPGKPEKAAAQVYLNVGYYTDVVDPSTGETVHTFISLPLGIQLDTMEPMPLRGNNENWNAIVTSKNELMAQLQELAASIEAGDGKEVSGLTIEIRRRGEAQAPAPGTNPYTMPKGQLSLVG